MSGRGNETRKAAPEPCLVIKEPKKQFCKAGGAKRMKAMPESQMRRQAAWGMLRGRGSEPALRCCQLEAFLPSHPLPAIPWDQPPSQRDFFCYTKPPPSPKASRAHGGAPCLLTSPLSKADAVQASCSGKQQKEAAEIKGGK